MPEEGRGSEALAGIPKDFRPFSNWKYLEDFQRDQILRESWRLGSVMSQNFKTWRFMTFVQAKLGMTSWPVIYMMGFIICSDTITLWWFIPDKNRNKSPVFQASREGCCFIRSSWQRTYLPRNREEMPKSTSYQLEYCEIDWNRYDNKG